MRVTGDLITEPSCNISRLTRGRIHVQITQRKPLAMGVFSFSSVVFPTTSELDLAIF
jgi:hypothetical protein